MIEIKNYKYVRQIHGHVRFHKIFRSKQKLSKVFQFGRNKSLHEIIAGQSFIFLVWNHLSFIVI